MHCQAEPAELLLQHNKREALICIAVHCYLKPGLLIRDEKFSLTDSRPCHLDVSIRMLATGLQEIDWHAPV